MKKIMFLATAVAMALAMAMPTQAQTRKDKKAAAKAQWEMEQQQKREEAELRHQLRMDSIANAQKVAAQKAAAAEAERRQKEEEAKAEAQRQAAVMAAQEVELDEPCMDAASTSTTIRARGIGESLQHQAARTKAQTQALRDLAAKINVSVKSLLKSYVNDEMTDMMNDEMSSTNMYIEEKMQNMVKQVVDQNLSYSVACEQTKTYMKNNRKVYKCYMVVQVGKDEVLKPIFEEIQKENSIRLNMDYKKFKRNLIKNLKNNSKTYPHFAPMELITPSVALKLI